MSTDGNIFLVAQEEVIEDYIAKIENHEKTDDDDKYLHVFTLVDIIAELNPWYLDQGVPNDVY
jgi:hypothetical protein